MGYASDLRKFVGNRSVILVGATIMVLNDKGEILLNRRTDTNTWGIREAVWKSVSLWRRPQPGNYLKRNDDESSELSLFDFSQLPELESRAAYIIERYRSRI